MSIISFNGIDYGCSGSPKIEQITEANYQALVQAGEVDPSIAYFRMDAPSLYPLIQDDGTATDLDNGKLATGQTIKSYLGNKFAYWQLDYDTYFSTNLARKAYLRVTNVPFPKTFPSAPKMLIGGLTLTSEFSRGVVIEFDSITSSSSAVSIINGDIATVDRGTGWKINIFAIF